MSLHPIKHKIVIANEYTSDLKGLYFILLNPFVYTKIKLFLSSGDMKNSEPTNTSSILSLFIGTNKASLKFDNFN